MRVLCTLVNNARTMYISQQCAYYCKLVPTMRGIMRTVYITQQCAYYVHYQQCACMYINSNARTMYN